MWKPLRGCHAFGCGSACGSGAKSLRKAPVNRALTDWRDRFYSRSMDSPLETMSEAGAEAAAERREGAAAPPPSWTGLGLRDLEGQIDSLIEERDRLREENVALKNRQVSLSGECARLIERSEAVRSRVETMIARLRAMEGS